MVTLEIDHSLVKIKGASQEAIKAIGEVARYRPKDFMFSKKYKEGKWDGWIRLLKKAPTYYYLPAGLLFLVRRALDEIGESYVLQDTRNKGLLGNRARWSWISPKPLRDYQIGAVEAGVRKSRGIWELATGSGKMLTAAKFFQTLGLPGIITVLTEEAVRDTSRELEESIGGARIGRWYKDEKSTGDIVVTTIPSLHAEIKKKHSRLKDHFERTEVLIMDEAHMMAADTYYEVMQKSKAYYKIGQTGTPYRSDGKDLLLLACTGRVMIQKKAKELQEEGILSQAKIVFYHSPPPAHLSIEALAERSPKDRYMDSIVYNEPRNRLISELYHSQEVQTAVIVKYIEHGEILADIIGIPFVSSKVRNRAEIQSGLNDGSLLGVVATTIFDMSVNIPGLTRIINAAGHSPEARQTQRLGRVIRLFDGKEWAYFYDFMDDWDNKAWLHSRNRLKYMKSEGHEVEIKTPELEYFS